MRITGLRGAAKDIFAGFLLQSSSTDWREAAGVFLLHSRRGIRDIPNNRSKKAD